MKALFLRLRHKVRVARGKWHEAKKRKTRSPQWPAVERRHLNLNPFCAACGSQKELQVHHLKPFNLFPKLELQPDNLLTLCMDDAEDHLLLGHGGYFSAYNPDILEHLEMLKRGTPRHEILTLAKSKRLK